ncbi:serine hydrolase domain-containing protein [Sphingomicrobium arenosum]|uniref:serine hydrolase domain-containing protein n=1 Tax=Sphingomicrobium arenosum TaxID=2233861 RepID=UPI002240F8A5|nr:serine hydrolase domain-containing protein [Sphingomicrobium arenosum]
MYVTLMALAGLQAATTQAMPNAIDRAAEQLQPAVIIAGEEETPRSIEALMAELAVPGVSVAIIEDNEIVAARSFGWARHGEGWVAQPMTTDTRFQVASLSKAVSAAGTAIWADTRGIALDAPVQPLLGDWTLENGEDVSLADLLSHRGGTTVSGFPGYGPDQEIPTLDAILDGVDGASNEKVRVEPEARGRFRYSGGGYTVVQKAIEASEGEGFAAVMDRLLLSPLGMSASQFNEPATAASNAHDADGQPIAGGHRSQPEAAAAGLWSTPSDVARFVIAMNRAAAGEDGGPISPAMADFLLTAPDDSSVYAHGFGVVTEGGLRRFAHSGSNIGMKSILFGWPEAKAGMVILTNSERGPILYRALADALAEEMGLPLPYREEVEAASWSEAALARYEGLYRLDEYTYDLVRHEGGLAMIASGGEPFAVRLLADGRLLRLVDQQLWGVVEDENGGIGALTLRGTPLPRAH